MTTTVMRDSTIGDDWIRRACEMNPAQVLVDQTTGQPSGNILTGPVRLAFCDLFKPGRSMNEGQEGKYQTQALFSPFTDFSVFYNAYYEVLAREFAEYYDAASGQYHGLHSPFRDQSEKLKFGGYTPGLVFMTCTSRYKPPLVDSRMNPIVDESRVYAGVWAILSINAYAFGKSPPQPKKGVSFGLQSVMVIADDEKFGGGAPDPHTQFQGVNVEPPAGAPGAMFGQPGMPGPAPGAPAPGAPVPGAPGMPAPGGAPAAPGFTPPPPSAPTSAPVTPPAATGAPGTTAPSGTASPSDEDMSFLG